MTTNEAITETCLNLFEDAIQAKAQADAKAHRWTACQIQHLKDTAHLSIYKAVRSLRHRFGQRVAKLTDNAIKGKRYHVLHPEKQQAQIERRRVGQVMPYVALWS